MKSYLVQTLYEGESSAKMMTAKEFADVYELEQIAGIGMDFEVFDVDQFGKVIQLNSYEIAKGILEEQRWIEQEYRDYCEAVNEYGYNFESMYE